MKPEKKTQPETNAEKKAKRLEELKKKLKENQRVVLSWVKEQTILRIFCNEKIKNRKSFFRKTF
jgi:hypothetical protein